MPGSPGAMIHGVSTSRPPPANHAPDGSNAFAKIECPRRSRPEMLGHEKGTRLRRGACTCSRSRGSKYRRRKGRGQKDALLDPRSDGGSPRRPNEGGRAKRVSPLTARVRPTRMSAKLTRFGHHLVQRIPIISDGKNGQIVQSLFDLDNLLPRIKSLLERL